MSHETFWSGKKGAVVKFTQLHFQRFENVPRNVLEREKWKLLLNLPNFTSRGSKTSQKRHGAEGRKKGQSELELLHSPNFTSRGSIMSFDSCSPVF